MPSLSFLGRAAGLLAVCALFPASLRAQTWQWAAIPTGSASVAASAAAANGEVVVAGSFAGTLQWGPFQLTSAGEQDVFVVRLNSSGSCIQANRFGGTGNDQATALLLDRNGDAVVTGQFGSPTMAVGAATLTNTTAAGIVTDVFVARLSAGGTWLQAAQAGGPGYDYATGLARDLGGNVTVVGSFTGPSFAAGSTSLVNAGTNTSDVFVARLSTAGTWSQAARAGGSGDDEASAVAVDASGTAVVAGFFQSATAAFGSSTLTNADASGQEADAFVARLDAAGTWGQVVRAGSAGAENIRAVALDGTGTLVAVGDFTGASTAFGSTTLANLDATGTTSDIFVARLSPVGTWASAITTGSTAQDYAIALAADAAGNAVVVGSFSGPALTLGPIRFTNYNTSGTPSSDLFIARLNATDTWTDMRQAGGTGDDYATCVAADVSGSAYLGGALASAGGRFDGITIPSSTGGRAFLARLNGLPAMPSAVRPGQAGQLAFEVYPNPVQDGRLLVAGAALAQGPAQVEVLDALGRVVRTQAVTAAAPVVSVASLPAGLYTVRLRQGTGTQYQKVVVGQ